MSATATDTLTCPIDSLLLKTADAIYQPVAGLSLTAWCTPEPVTFAQRTQGVKKSVHIGEPWGEKLFDCAWFRFTAELPADLPHDLPTALDGNSPDGTSGTNLVARIDIGGELLLVDKNGSPVRGLTLSLIHI